MIISSDLEAAFTKLQPFLEDLQKAADELLLSIADKCRGSYEGSRIKPLESIVAKTEKESIKYPFKEIDDLLAATVVLPTRKQMLEFEKQVAQFCEIVESKSEREIEPEKFVYDDRHLILRFRSEYHAVLEKPFLGEFLFEVQLKTYLQYALGKWSRGTYKTSDFSWALNRLISRTRALVEMADTALARIEDGALEPGEVVEFEQYVRRNKIIALLKEKLNPVQLPEDMRRLAITTEKYLNILYKFENENPEKQSEILRNLSGLLDKNQDIVSSESLTAYNSVFIALFRENKGQMTRKLSDGQFSLTRKSMALLVTSEMLSFCPELANLAPESRVDLSFPESAVRAQFLPEAFEQTRPYSQSSDQSSDPPIS